jgi:DNA-binding NtrC family response regulator
MQAPEPAHDAPVCRVLLIDDEPAILRIYSRALANYGFESKCVSDPKLALQLLEQVAFDVVVSDVCMPGGDGVDLVRSIRERFPHLPVILVSGKPTDSAKTRAIIGGAIRYLVKPVMPTVLRSVIESAVRTGPGARSA